jgi:hypothetical protein
MVHIYVFIKMNSNYTVNSIKWEFITSVKSLSLMGIQISENGW